jgi:hypothetical protein
LVYDLAENVGATLFEFHAHGGPVGHHCGFVRASGIDALCYFLCVALGIGYFVACYREGTCGYVTCFGAGFDLTVEFDSRLVPGGCTGESRYKRFDGLILENASYVSTAALSICAYFSTGCVVLAVFLRVNTYRFYSDERKATTFILALGSMAGCAVRLVLGVYTYSMVSWGHKATYFLVAFVSTAVSTAGLLLPEDFLNDVCGPLPNTLRGLLFMGLICYGVVQCRQLPSLSLVAFSPLGSPGGGPTGGGAPPLTPLVYDRTENAGTTVIELQAPGGPVGHHCGFVRASGIDYKRPYEHDHVIWIIALVLLGRLVHLNLPAVAISRPKRERSRCRSGCMQPDNWGEFSCDTRCAFENGHWGDCLCNFHHIPAQSTNNEEEKPKESQDDKGNVSEAQVTQALSRRQCLRWHRKMKKNLKVLAEDHARNEWRARARIPNSNLYYEGYVRILSRRIRPVNATPFQPLIAQQRTLGSSMSMH